MGCRNRNKDVRYHLRYIQPNAINPKSDRGFRSKKRAIKRAAYSARQNFISLGEYIEVVAVDCCDREFVVAKLYCGEYLFTHPES